MRLHKQLGLCHGEFDTFPYISDRFCCIYESFIKGYCRLYSFEKRMRALYWFQAHRSNIWQGVLEFDRLFGILQNDRPLLSSIGFNLELLAFFPTCVTFLLSCSMSLLLADFSGIVCSAFFCFFRLVNMILSSLLSNVLFEYYNIASVFFHC